MKDVLNYFFNWYDGAIWGNLVASAITTFLGMIFIHRHQKRHHHETMRSLDALHTKYDQRHRPGEWRY